VNLLRRFLATTLLLAAWPAAAEEAATPAGARASVPDFELASLDGRFVTLSQLPSQVTLVNFWHSECPPCRREMPAIAAFAQTTPSLRVITVALQGRRATERDGELLPRGGLHLLGPANPRPLLARFGNRSGAVPHSAMLDRERRICARRTGEIDGAWLRDAARNCGING
jgi:thiol-disulfide isomerase/thioredoxin